MGGVTAVAVRGPARVIPPDWGMDLYRGDLWAACTADVSDYSETWDELDPADTWDAQPPAGTWTDDLFAAPAAVPVLDGTLVQDWQGAAARTRATVVLPRHPSTDAAVPGRWIRLHGHLCRAADAPPDGDPATVPAVTMAVLYIVGRERDRAAATVTLSADDLVALLGARELDTGAGPTGYLPAARTALGVIAELLAAFAPIAATLDRGTAADRPWAPAVDDATGTPVPLTGTVWSAIETMCELAACSAAADGPYLRLASKQWGAKHTGLTVTETPDADGIQAVESIRHQAPAVTRVIATGTDVAGNTLAARAHDLAGRTEQGLDRDETITVSGVTTPVLLSSAAQARLQYQKAARQGGRVLVPWLPHLQVGDLLTVAWDDIGSAIYYLGSVGLPLDPAEPVALELRGPALPRWQDEPPDATWDDLSPTLTWEEDV